jgi:hypothetical protein
MAPKAYLDTCVWMALYDDPNVRENQSEIVTALRRIVIDYLIIAVQMSCEKSPLYVKKLSVDCPSWRFLRPNLYDSAWIKLSKVIIEHPIAPWLPDGFPCFDDASSLAFYKELTS